MAALNFPNSPSNNDLHTENGLTFKWNGTIWKKVGPAYTDTTNLNVTGIGTIAGNFHVGGVLTYEDVKNVDSVGIITARSGIDCNGNATFGANGTITTGSNFSLNGNALTVTGTSTVVGEFKKAGNATIQCTDTTNSTDLQLRANATGGLVRTAANKPLILGTNQQERLRIDSAGRVGIGTDTMDSSAELSITNASSSARIYMKSADNADCSVYFGSMNDAATGAIRYDHSDDSFRFYGYNNSERLRIASDGKVGINCASPGQLLEINGSSNPCVLVKDTTNNCISYMYSQDSVATFGSASAHDVVFNVSNGEKVRIDTSGRLRVGNTTESADGAFDDLIVGSYSGNRGITILSTNGQQGALGFAKSGTNADGYLAYVHNSTATSSAMTLKSSGTIHFNAGTNALERFRIETSGITVYGNENNFYGGGGGTNLNGDIKIRSTGTAVYQSLKFMSSDGSSQSQILGYGGGAILFHYSNTFVWAINNQGERLELTNTALSPRSSSTVLDLGTSSKPYRNIYTNDLNLSNERMGSNDVDGTWGSYTIQEGENDLFLLNRRNGKKYKFNLTEVS